MRPLATKFPRALTAALALALSACPSKERTSKVGDAGHDGDIADASPDTDANVTADGAVEIDFDTCLTGLESRPDTRVLRFHTEDNLIRIGIASAGPADLCPDWDNCICNGESCFTYDLLSFAMERGGHTVCITDAAALEYEGGHHSANEKAIALTGDDRYVVRSFWADSGWADTFTVFDPETFMSREGPYDLVTEDCYSVPAGQESPCCERCFNRERSDL